MTCACHFLHLESIHQRWREWNKRQWDRYTGATTAGSSGSSGSGLETGGDGKGGKHNAYADNKPIETRTFRVPTSTQSQGGLTMWLDIMSTAEARLNPPVDISLPGAGGGVSLSSPSPQLHTLLHPPPLSIITLSSPPHSPPHPTSQRRKCCRCGWWCGTREG
jgi:hypothetical protein